MREVMIMVAPNGARRGKADHPALPLTPDELVVTSVASAAAGAGAIHLHVRDGAGSHSLDPDLYRAAVTPVRHAVPDLVVQVTTEAVGRYSPAEQMETVRALRPEAVSIALRELVPNGAAEAEAAAFLGWMAANRVAPQFILYAPEEVTRCIDLVRRGVIPHARPFLLFVLGRHGGGKPAEPRDLHPFVAALGAEPYPWAVCAFGEHEADCAVAAARRGGHVRVGFENNFRLPDGAVAPDNAALVAATAGMIRAAGFGIMSPRGARRLMGVETA